MIQRLRRTIWRCTTDEESPRLALAAALRAAGARCVEAADFKTLRAKLKAVAPAIEPIRTLRGTGYALSEDLPESV